MKKHLLLGLILLPLYALSACDLPPEENGDGGGGGSNNYTGYEALFSENTLHEVEVVISQEEWDGHIQDMKDYAENDPIGLGRTGKYRKARFVYRGKAGDRTIAEVGFRTKGNASRTIPQEIDDETGEHGALHRAHFKVKFNEAFDLVEGSTAYQRRDDRRFCRLRKLDFRMNAFDPPWWDKSQIREIYSFDLLRRAGVLAPRTSSAKLIITIEGVRHDFGIYTVVEPVDKSFLTKRFGRDGNDGNLYKCLFGDSGPATLEPIEDPPGLRGIIFREAFPERRVIGSKDWETNYRPTYDLKTNEDEANHTVLINFINKLNALSGGDLKSYLDNHFKVNEFLMAQAVNVILGKWDDYWPMGNNYYLYFNNRGKIEFIPVDYDMVLGQAIPMIETDTVGIYEWTNIVNQFISLQMGVPVLFLDWMRPWESPLVKKILAIPEYRAVYEQNIIDLITPANELFVYSDYEKTYKKMAALYAGHLDNDINENEEMKNEGSVRDYFYTRTKAVIAELGLNEADFETRATSLDPPFGVSTTGDISSGYITVTWDSEVYGDTFDVFRSDSEDGTYEGVGEHIREYVFVDDAVGDDAVLAPSGVTASEGLLNDMVQVLWEASPPATVYYYKVKAYTDDGVESDFSLPVAGYTDNAEYYRVYRSETIGGPYSQVGGNLHGTAFYDLTVDAGVPYYYKVKAYNETGDESDFSAEALGRASAGGADGPEIIQGEALVSGTYRSTDETIGTYTFDEGGSCTKIMAAPEDDRYSDYYRLEGTWQYEGPNLVIDTSAELGFVATIRVIETYPNAFTTDNGESLYIVGARQIKPDGGEFSKFVGGGQFRVIVISSLFADETITPIGVTVIVNEDGSGNATLIIGEEPPITESWPAGFYESQLIEFDGAYFLPMEAESILVRQ